MNKEELQREKEIEELKQLLSVYGNRAWLWKLLEYCKAFMTISSHDPHNMAILSGRRDCGLWVLREIISADPEAFIKMQIEASDREKELKNDSRAVITE